MRYATLRDPYPQPRGASWSSVFRGFHRLSDLILWQPGRELQREIFRVFSALLVVSFSLRSDVHAEVHAH